MRASVLAALSAVALAVAISHGQLAGLLVLTGWVLILFFLLIVLPRLAHRAFRQGRFKRSKLLYKLLRLWVFSQSSRVAVDVSLAACALAVEDFSGALAKLERIDESKLTSGARAAWLNNRAYALVRAERDIHTALGYCDEAIRLRPDVSGFRHTRGVILLALGRVDEAIGELERLWDDMANHVGDELPLLEAERCYDLGTAWSSKGEHDYALDYFQRAHRASPGSRWAERAAVHLRSAGAPTPADFLEG